MKIIPNQDSCPHELGLANRLSPSWPGWKLLHFTVLLKICFSVKSPVEKTSVQIPHVRQKTHIIFEFFSYKAGDQIQDLTQVIDSLSLNYLLCPGSILTTKILQASVFLLLFPLDHFHQGNTYPLWMWKFCFRSFTQCFLDQPDSKGGLVINAALTSRFPLHFAFCSGSTWRMSDVLSSLVSSQQLCLGGQLRFIIGELKTGRFS